MKTTNQATGHRDRNDKMIHRHDLVLAARQLLPGIKGKKTEAPRPAHVLWVDRQWLLRFEDGTTEPLNYYPRHGLEIVGTISGTTAGQPRDNRGTEKHCPGTMKRLSQTLSRALSQSKRLKISDLDENGTMGQ